MLCLQSFSCDVRSFFLRNRLLESMHLLKLRCVYGPIHTSTIIKLWSKVDCQQVSSEVKYWNDAKISCYELSRSGIEYQIKQWNVMVKWEVPLRLNGRWDMRRWTRLDNYEPVATNQRWPLLNTFTQTIPFLQAGYQSELTKSLARKHSRPLGNQTARSRMQDQLNKWHAFVGESCI